MISNEIKDSFLLCGQTVGNQRHVMKRLQDSYKVISIHSQVICGHYLTLVMH